MHLVKKGYTVILLIHKINQAIANALLRLPPYTVGRAIIQNYEFTGIRFCLFSMICCPSNVQQFLRSVGLPGTPSERVRVRLRGKLRISAPTVLFAQSQGKMFKTKYISRQMGRGVINVSKVSS